MWASKVLNELIDIALLVSGFGTSHKVLATGLGFLDGLTAGVSTFFVSWAAEYYYGQEGLDWLSKLQSDWGWTAGSVLGTIAVSMIPCGMGALTAYRRIMGAVDYARTVVGAVEAFANGDYIGGAVNTAFAILGARNIAKACFAGDMEVITKRGWVRWDELRAGDEVLSRDEDDPDGPAAFKLVEEIFHTQAVLWHVHLGGGRGGSPRILKTTAEHPFWVEGKGWTAAGHLQVGDELLDQHGNWLPVTDLHDTGVAEPVYNCRVAEYHTYFTGHSTDGPWAVWAHNYNLNANSAKSKFGVYEMYVKGNLYKVGKADMNRITKSTGLPTRLHQQVRKLRELHGVRNVTSSITALGRTTTLKAKAAETARLQSIYNQTGKVPKGNEKSFVPEMP